MSIKRITNPDEFCQLIDELDSLFELENSNHGHAFLKHNKDTIKASYAHASILTWELFVWANKEDGKFTAAIMFANDKNAKFGQQIFSEFLWLSKDARSGFQLFNVATRYARDHGFKIMSMSTVVKHPQHERVKAFYKTMGLIKDSETYICKL